MFRRVKIVLVAATLLATACSGAAVDEGPDAAAETSVAVTTTVPATITTTEAPEATQPAGSEPEETESGRLEPEAQPIEPPDPESVAVTTTVPATITTTEAPEATQPAGSEPEETESGRLEPEAQPIEPPDPEGVGDSFYPKLGNPGYDIIHYDIELDVEPSTNTISARTAITAQATDDLATFNLDLSGLEVLSVAVDGADAGFSRSGHELTVEPASPLTAGSQFEVQVAYSGSPEATDDPGVEFFTLGWQQQDDVIYTASEPSGSMTWFPSNNHPTDKATYEIQITVPEGITAASNGLLIDETTTDGRTTYTWRMDDPMATYLAAVYIGEFERIDHGPLYPDGPVIRDYVHSTAAPEIAEALAVTPDVIAFLEDLLGPYPFDAYGTIVMPFTLGFALENQTLPVHGQASIGPGIIAHEAAHQWLGNSVTLEDWSDIWLNEGFATYLHLMFEAGQFGADFDDTMAAIYAQLIAVEEIPPKGIEVEDLLGLTVYFRGAVTLHALRRHAGDEIFFEILRTHYDRSAGGTTNTEEFLGLVEEFAGPDAVDVVESWLFDETVPSSL